MGLSPDLVCQNKDIIQAHAIAWIRLLYGSRRSCQILPTPVCLLDRTTLPTGPCTEDLMLLVSMPSTRQACLSCVLTEGANACVLVSSRDMQEVVSMGMPDEVLQGLVHGTIGHDLMNAVASAP